MENNPTVAGGRIVWLDVVRLVAMFTVVCCPPSVRSAFRHDNGRPSPPGQG